MPLPAHKTERQKPLRQRHMGLVQDCHSPAQPVEKRPAKEMSRQAAKHKRYIWAENSRKESGDSRFAVHLASFLRFMAANLRAYPETNDEPG